MSDLLRIVIIVVALIFSALSIGLLLRRRMSERSSILWLTGTLIVLLLGIFPQTLNWIAERVGVDYPPSLLYLVGIMALLLVILYQSTQIARMDEQLRKIGQVVALMGFDVQSVHSSSEFRSQLEVLEQVAAAVDRVKSSNHGETPSGETIANVQTVSEHGMDQRARDDSAPEHAIPDKDATTGKKVETR